MTTAGESPRVAARPSAPVNAPACSAGVDGEMRAAGVNRGDASDTKAGGVTPGESGGGGGCRGVYAGSGAAAKRAASRNASEKPAPSNQTTHRGNSMPPPVGATLVC